jgi:hypothetical protein
MDTETDMASRDSFVVLIDHGSAWLAGGPGASPGYEWK